MKEGVMLCSGYGEKIQIDKRISTTGGGATNAAVAFERLGLDAAVVACVGTGHWGRLVKHTLRDEGVSLPYLQETKDQPTSSSIALVGEDGGRTVLVHRAASNYLKWNDVPWEKLDAKWFYVSSLGGNMTLLAKIFRFAKEKGIKIALNPGSMEIKRASELKTYFKQVEILILNKYEALKFFQKPMHEQELDKTKLCNIGAQATLITDGKNGCRLYHCMGEVLFQPAIKAKAIDETGAGDSFGATFIAGLMNDASYEDSLSLAALNSSSVVREIGPKKGLLYWPEIKKLLKEYSRKK
jgi:sugar/nucleoside kinase (ribokinase family)